MAKVRFTESFVRSQVPLGPREMLIFDAGQPGLALRVIPSGAKTYVVRVKIDGRQVKVTLGRVGEISVAEARDAAREAITDLKAGQSPALAREARKQAAKAGLVTVGEVADRWLDEVVRPKRKPLTVRDYELVVKNHIKPKFGRKPIAGIKHSDIVTWHAEGRRTPRAANYRVAVLKTLCSFAERVELRPPNSNPCKGIEFYPERLVERFLSADELAKAAQAIDDCEKKGVVGPFAAAGLRLAIMTGARSNEIVGLKWEYLDLKRRVARLPDSKTGAKNLHLSPAAVEVLKTVPRVGPWVIAGANPEKPYVRLGHAWERVRTTVGLDDVRLHDLRHTFASVAAANGLSLPMIGKLLGHKIPATTQRYAHLAVDVTTEANDAVGAALTAAMVPKPKPPAGANVVPLRKSRKAR